MHTQNRPISKNFYTLHLFEPRSEKMGVFLKRKLKVLSLVWNGEGFLGVFLQILLKISLENKKSPPDSLNREEKVVEKILNCELLCGNSENTVCISTLDKRYLLGRSWDRKVPKGWNQYILTVFDMSRWLYEAYIF